METKSAVLGIRRRFAESALWENSLLAPSSTCRLCVLCVEVEGEGVGGILEHSRLTWLLNLSDKSQELGLWG